jgi:hypothetical protein
MWPSEGSVSSRYSFAGGCWHKRIATDEEILAIDWEEAYAVPAMIHWYARVTFIGPNFRNRGKNRFIYFSETTAYPI